VSTSLPHLYTDLARWWPLLSPAEGYADEAAMIAGLLRAGLAGSEASHGARRPVLLELGSGGGHNAVHLAQHVEVILVDASAEMLAVSRRLNPVAEHVQGDMRRIRLERVVDAVLVHDAIDYMLTEDDLDAVFATARAHLTPGGVAVFVPDHTRETFVPGTEHGGTDGPDGSGVRYLGWTWDPDPEDTWAQTEYAILTRDVDGRVSATAESHRFGLFPIATWVSLLERRGFEVTVVTEHEESDEQDEYGSRTLFVARVVQD
jgi:SAM-dependent methyltransferase